MKRISSLSDLLMEELADLLDAEHQLVEALPKIAGASQSKELRLMLEDHTQESREQADRLEDIFSNIGYNPYGSHCKGMKGFLAQIEGIANAMEKSSARDAALIRVAQQIENYEICNYGTAREHAEDLGHTRIVELLEDTLNQERQMNLNLSELAQSMINVQAIVSEGP